MERQHKTDEGDPIAKFLVRIIELSQSAIHWWANNADFSDTEASLRAQVNPATNNNDMSGPINYE